MDPVRVHTGRIGICGHGLVHLHLELAALESEVLNRQASLILLACPGLMRTGSHEMPGSKATIRQSMPGSAWPIRCSKRACGQSGSGFFLANESGCDNSMLCFPPLPLMLWLP